MIPTEYNNTYARGLKKKTPLDLLLNYAKRRVQYTLRLATRKYLRPTRGAHCSNKTFIIRGASRMGQRDVFLVLSRSPDLRDSC